MSKTLELRKVLTTKLNTVSGATYYRYAPDDASFPYKVFKLRNVVYSPEGARDTIQLEVTVWDRAKDPATVEALADGIETLFAFSNLPQTEILPTIWKENRQLVEDKEQHIECVLLHFQIQNYEVT